MKNKQNNQSILLAACISFLMALCAVLLWPGTLANSVDATNDKTFLNAVLTVVSIAALFCLTAFFIQVKRGSTFKKALERCAFLAAFLFAGALVLSLISGVLAVLFQKLLSGILSLTAIKRLIDTASAVLVMAALPLCLSVFWSETYNRGSVWNAFLTGIRAGGKKYLKLLALSLLLFAAGYLAVLLANDAGIAGKIIAILLMMITGTAGILCSDKIWTRKEGRA